MAKKIAKAAYFVFRGRETGIYYTWPECEAQVLGFSKGHQRGYDTVAEAEVAWAEWERKVSSKLAILSKTPLEPANVARHCANSIHPPSHWIEPPAPSFRRPANVVEPPSPLRRPAPTLSNPTALLNHDLLSYQIPIQTSPKDQQTLLI